MYRNSKNSTLKMICFALALLMVLSACSCGKDAKEKNTESGTDAKSSNTEKSSTEEPGTDESANGIDETADKGEAYLLEESVVFENNVSDEYFNVVTKRDDVDVNILAVNFINGRRVGRLKIFDYSDEYQVLLIGYERYEEKQKLVLINRKTLAVLDSADIKYTESEIVGSAFLIGDPSVMIIYEYEESGIAYSVSCKDGKIHVSDFSRQDIYPHYESCAVSPNGKYIAGRVLKDGFGTGYIEYINENGEHIKIYEGTFSGDNTRGEGAKLVGFIDDTHIVCNIYGWEWVIGYFVYDTESGELTEYREGECVSKAANGKLYTFKFIGSYQIESFDIVEFDFENGTKRIKKHSDDERLMHMLYHDPDAMSNMTFETEQVKISSDDDRMEKFQPYMEYYTLDDTEHSLIRYTGKGIYSAAFSGNTLNVIIYIRDIRNTGNVERSDDEDVYLIYNEYNDYSEKKMLYKWPVYATVYENGSRMDVDYKFPSADDYTEIFGEKAPVVELIWAPALRCGIDDDIRSIDVFGDDFGGGFSLSSISEISNLKPGEYNMGILIERKKSVDGSTDKETYGSYYFFKLKKATDGEIKSK